MDRKVRITVLVSARRNSKYLAKFLFGLYFRTAGRVQTLVMLNEHDTWNNELVEYFDDMVLAQHHVEFYRENLQLGRAGLATYFNLLVQHARGDWIVYFCEDHFITRPDWDDYILDVIDGHRKVGDGEGKKFPLNPAEPWVLVPKFDNCGAMNHIVSRGYVKALGGVIGRHGWIDSYINDMVREIPERVIRLDDETFHDFTHDHPTPMDDSHVQALSTEKGKALPTYEDPRVAQLRTEDLQKIRNALEKGARRELQR